MEHSRNYIQKKMFFVFDVSHEGEYGGYCSQMSFPYMNLSDILPPGFQPVSPSLAARRHALSEPFRRRGRIERLSLCECRFEHAQHLVRFCGFTAAAARLDAGETFPA